MRLKTQLNVLDALTEYGFRMNASRLASALVMEHGMDREKLAPYLRAAEMLRWREKKIFDGSLTFMFGFVKRNDLIRMHDLLLKEARSMSSKEISESLAMNILE